MSNAFPSLLLAGASRPSFDLKGESTPYAHLLSSIDNFLGPTTTITVLCEGMPAGERDAAAVRVGAYLTPLGRKVKPYQPFSRGLGQGEALLLSGKGNRGAWAYSMRWGPLRAQLLELAMSATPIIGVGYGAEVLGHSFCAAFRDPHQEKAVGCINADIVTGFRQGIVGRGETDAEQLQSMFEYWKGSVHPAIIALDSDAVLRTRNDQLRLESGLAKLFHPNKQIDVLPGEYLTF